MKASIVLAIACFFTLQLQAQEKKASNTLQTVKSYTLDLEKLNVVTLNDLSNALTTRVPNVQVQQAPLSNLIRSIRIRNCENNIVIVDGVRFDASILNALNPNDIEKITIIPSNTSINYYNLTP